MSNLFSQGRIHTFLICFIIFGNILIVSTLDNGKNETVLAETIIVDVNGDGDYESIQEAVDEAKPGDTIFVKSGTYYGNVVIDKSLSLIGNGSENTTIMGDFLSNVIFVNADNVAIEGFSISRAGNSAIYLSKVQGCSVVNCTLIKNTYGITLEEGSKNIISNNTCTINSYGIYALSTSNNTIKNNNISDNSHVGIYLEMVSHNFIINNTCNSNNGNQQSLLDEEIRNCGIYLIYSNGNIISNNICTLNYNYGILATLSDSNEIRDNVCLVNGFGIYDNTCQDNWIENNTCEKSTVDGIILMLSENSTVMRNTCDSNYENGIHIVQSSFARVTSNLLSNNYINGIYISYSVCSIRENICENNQFEGIMVIVSEIDLEDNICNFNGDSGITIDQCRTNSDISNNICNYNNYSGFAHSGNSPLVLSNNTCNENGFFGIHLSYASYATIINNTCSQNKYYGIALSQSRDNWIGMNTCTMNEHGIYLSYRSVENDIVENECSMNEAAGISLVSRCGLNNVSRNKCYTNKGDGIALIASHCNIVDSNEIFSNQAKGIMVSSSTSNMIFLNDIGANKDMGISLGSPLTNHIFQNNLTDNNAGLIQAFDEFSSNIWDNGVSRGNFWSDYPIRYPKASTNGNIWSNPYTIDTSGINQTQDRYPLVSFKPKDDQTPPYLMDEKLMVNASTGDQFNISISVDDNVGVNSAFLIYGFEAAEYLMEALEKSDNNNWYVEISIPENVISLNYSFLVIDDEANFLLTGSKLIYVDDNDKPVASAASDSEIWEGSFAELDASGSRDNIGIVKYEWIIEDHDGERKTEGIVSSATFNFPGTYKVILRVEDAAGNQDNDSLFVDVKEFPPGVEVLANERINWAIPCLLFIGICIVIVIIGSLISFKKRKVRFLIKGPKAEDLPNEVGIPLEKEIGKTVKRVYRKKKKAVSNKSKTTK